MDPLTYAAERFIRAHEVAWAPPPGSTDPVPAALRIAVADYHRREALNSLRLLEWRPENRRPVAIVETLFEEESAYLRELVFAVRSDVLKVDKALREDGVSMPVLPEGPATLSVETVVAHLEALATHLATFLDGLVLVLAPKCIVKPEAFNLFAKRLVALRRSPSFLRLDVLALACPGVERAIIAAVPFEVDDDALFEHLKNLGTKDSEGPKVEIPALPPEKRKEIEATLGQPLTSIDAGRTLKRLLMEGGHALDHGRPKEAVKKFRAARSLTVATGLKDQELFTTIALGTAYATTQNLKGAEATFRRAHTLAAARGRRDIEAQCFMGLGTVYMLARRFGDALAAYQALHEAAEDGSPMKAEALRLIEAAKHGDLAYGAQEARQ